LKNYHFGILAELFVALIYLLTFHKILAWRYKTKIGEIDLIFEKKNLLIFVEVKARRQSFDKKFFGPWQKRRIKNTAKLFTSRNSRYRNYGLRFDLAIVRTNKLPNIIRNAW